MGQGKTLAKMAAVVVLAGLAGAPGVGRAEEMRSHTEAWVQMFAPTDGTAMTCPWQKKTPGKALVARTAALPAVFAGLVVNWLFSEAVGYFARRLAEKIKLYTFSYSTQPRYVAAIHRSGPVKSGDDPDMHWVNSQSCVEMQRVHCTVLKSAIDDGSASCNGKDVEVGLSVIVKLKRDPYSRTLRVLPQSMRLLRLDDEKPHHDGGGVTVAAHFHVESMGWTGDGAGRPWSSPSVEVATLKCGIAKGSRKPATEMDCEHERKVDDNWDQAHVLPLPPPDRRQALVFSIGEVGHTSVALTKLQKFFNDNGPAMSEALSGAFKKKLGITEE